MYLRFFKIACKKNNMFYFLHKSISFVAVLTIDLANPISALEH